jgi:hypothetical protein
MADGILATVSGFSYQPFNAGGAMLVPIAELGDGVNVGGVYSTLGSIETEFDSMCASSIGAPADEEIDHEYPYLTKQEREVSRKVSLGKSYYGSRITRANGLEVVKTEADGIEKSRVKLNSDILAFYNDNGEEALYFDAMTGKYRFRGDVEVTGGSMNINDAFIVDPQGNLTLTGNINLSGGSIIWGSNLPPSGISATTAEQIASTVVTNELVAAPTISGAKVYSSEFYGNEFNVDAQGNNGSFNLYGQFQNNAYHFFEISYYEGEAPYIHIDSPGSGIMYLGGNAMELRVDSQTVFYDRVDFSNATVTGLDVVFG